MTSATDFPKSIERTLEGHCPLCDTELRDAPNAPIIGTDIWPLEGHPKTCEFCEVAWAIQVIEERPSLRTSRALNATEISALHNRESEVGDD